MSYMDLVRQGVALANTETASMQATVQYERYEGMDPNGMDRLYAPAIPLKAIVEFRIRQVRTTTGTLGTSTCSVMFLDIPVMLEATDGRGVSDKDIIKVQNAPDAALMGLGGFQDPGNGLPIPTEIYLG